MSIKIAKDDVRSGYNDLLLEYTKDAYIPGFRKGKVPRDVLVRKYGEPIKHQAMDKIISNAVTEIFKDGELPKESMPLPYSTPQLEGDPKIDLESDFEFSLVYDVLPVVKVEKWQGFEIEAPDVAIEDADIERELLEIRERNAIVLDKEEGKPAEKDDVATVNYCELDDSGAPVKNSKREDFTFAIGSLHDVYQFDDEIIGMKKGETKEFSKTFPADFENKELAEKTVKLQVSLTALKSKKLPDLDDDLAQDVDEKYKTLNDLKASIRERLQRDLDQRLRTIKANALLEKIMEGVPVEIPESMLRMELDSRWRMLVQRFNTDSAGLFKIMGNSNTNAESILEGWKPDAQKALHSRLIIETIMEELKLEVSADEQEHELTQMAERSGAKIEDIKKYYEGEQAQAYLKEEIKERKLFDILLEKNTVKVGKKETYVDLREKIR